MNITIDVRQHELLAEIDVGGEIDAYTAPELRAKLFPISEKKNIKMVVNLTNVTYMDSTGLGVFVGVFKNVRKQEGKFQIIGLSQRLRRLFEITGLSEIIDINSQVEGEKQ